MLFECLKLYTSQRINSYFLRSRPKVLRTIRRKHGTLIKRCHRCLDNNLHKIFQTNVPENTTGEILLIVVLMVILCLDN